MYAPASTEEQKSTKRRTPHSTPVLNAANKSYTSPSVKPRLSNSSSYNNGMQKLPEASVDSVQQHDSTMLPPSGRPITVNKTPLMGFTMGKLAEEELNNNPKNNKNSKIKNNKNYRNDQEEEGAEEAEEDGYDDNINNNNNHNYDTKDFDGSDGKASADNVGDISKNSMLRKSSIKKPKSVSRKSSTSKHRSMSSSSLASSTTSSPKFTKKPEKLASKKASHKIAEQGRRNRMNVAIAELTALIPQAYHDEVAIPSKATTVELASKYITFLLGEIDELTKGNLGERRGKQEENNWEEDTTKEREKKKNNNKNSSKNDGKKDDKNVDEDENIDEDVDVTEKVEGSVKVEKDRN